ncbi:hypothetical protein EVAR_22502_1 [Eumeta japonica]|uniref:Uncharacterized protein n=1 Tax=Eumeta variegata TaxID=151549 RepID=A0A4C1Z9J0_EUMVA|nr:hypothetical protein EVAR_22502_1 [Eumeta japonica]
MRSAWAKPRANLVLQTFSGFNIAYDLRYKDLIAMCLLSYIEKFPFLFSRFIDNLTLMKPKRSPRHGDDITPLSSHSAGAALTEIENSQRKNRVGKRRFSEGLMRLTATPCNYDIGILNTTLVRHTWALGRVTPHLGASGLTLGYELRDREL